MPSAHHPGAGSSRRLVLPHRVGLPGSHGHPRLPRRHLLIGLASLLAVALGVGLKWVGGREQRQRDAGAEAIREVLSLRARAGRAMWDQIGRETNAGVGVEEAGRRGRRSYLQAIGSVDLTLCPPDFTEAYLRYANAEREYERLAEAYSGGFGTTLMGLGEYIVTGRNPADRFADAQRVIDEADLWLVQAALRHGVDPAASSSSAAAPKEPASASAGSAGG